MEQEKPEMGAEQLAESPQAETTSTAVAPLHERTPLVAVEGGVLPIMPRSIEEAQRYASGLIKAGVVPEAFKFNEKQAREAGDLALQGQANAPLVLMGILKCLEIGVPPQTGLAGLLPLNGRFTVWGDLASALVQRTGMVAKQTKRRVGAGFDREKTPLGDWPNEYGWDVRYWRVGQEEEPYEQVYTVGDAKRQNLWMNQRKRPWIESPDRMLFNRARAFVLRDGFADGLHGLAIAEEVIDHMEEEAPVKGSRNLSALIDEAAADENGAEKCQRS